MAAPPSNVPTFKLILVGDGGTGTYTLSSHTPPRRSDETPRCLFSESANARVRFCFKGIQTDAMNRLNIARTHRENDVCEASLDWGV